MHPKTPETIYVIIEDKGLDHSERFEIHTTAQMDRRAEEAVELFLIKGLALIAIVPALSMAMNA